MKIAIVGTGVIGTIYGWALAKENEVYHIVYKNKFDKYNGRNIKMDIIDERNDEMHQNIISDYTYKCAQHITQKYDLIIVPVTAMKLIDAVKNLKEKSKDSRFLIMSSNWNGFSEIDRIVDKDKYVIGYAGGGGTFKEENGQNTLWGNIGNDIMLGTIYDCQKNLFNDIYALFKRIGIKPNVPDNIMHTLWMHNIDSAILGCALTKYADINQLIYDKEMIKLCFGAMNESYNICAKRGVNLEKYPETNIYKMPLEKLYPMFKNNILNNPVVRRYTAHAKKASDEMVYNFKLIYKSGKDLKMSMKSMDKLNDQVFK